METSQNRIDLENEFKSNLKKAMLKYSYCKNTIHKERFSINPNNLPYIGYSLGAEFVSGKNKKMLSICFPFINNEFHFTDEKISDFQLKVINRRFVKAFLTDKK